MLSSAASLFEQGGTVVLVLLVLSLIATTIVAFKLIQFAYLRINSRRIVEQSLIAWRKGYTQKAVELLAGPSRRQPAVRVVDAAMRGLLSERSEETVREEVIRVARNHVANLRAWLRVLELIASLSPLLGLLGTVLGMIEAFKRLESAGNQVDPAILSGGIWQALLTTAVGLIVAIPALITHQWLDRRVERCAHLMEDCATRVFTSMPNKPIAGASRNTEQWHSTEVTPDSAAGATLRASGIRKSTR